VHTHTESGINITERSASKLNVSFGQPGGLLVCSLRFLARSSSAESLPGAERRMEDAVSQDASEKRQRGCETTAALLEENSQHLLVTLSTPRAHITHTHTYIYIYIYVSHMCTHEAAIICARTTIIITGNCLFTKTAGIGFNWLNAGMMLM